MNYFAQGIQQGAEIGARSYLEKKKRDQDSALNKARLEFEANQLRENFKGQGGLQKLRQDFEADQAGVAFGRTTARDATINKYDIAKLDKTQAFQADEGDKNRDVTTSQGDKNRGLSERTEAARLFLEAQNLQRRGQEFSDKLSWEKDPANPENKYKVAHTDYLMRDVQPPPLPNATSALQNGRKASAPGELPTLTPAEAATAKPGTRYKTTDGRILTR